MTDAQLEVKSKQSHAEFCYEYRAFRKKCVTQGIVTFSRDYDIAYYIVRYRGMYVTYLYGNAEDKSKLRAVWNVIHTAEQLLKAEQFAKGIEGVKHESN